MVILVLAVLWAIVLVPPGLRSVRERRRTRVVGSFARRLAALALPEEERMAVIARPEGAVRPLGAARPAVANVVTLPVPTPTPAPVAPRKARAARPMPRLSRSEALRRRRVVLGVLAGLVSVTFAAGFLPALRFLWAVQLVVDVAALAYLIGLVRLRRLTVERAAKVRYLPRAAPAETVAIPSRTSPSAGAAAVLGSGLGFGPLPWTEDSPTIPLRRTAGAR